MVRNFQLPGRSPVYARRGMAATSHPLASEAAITTLRAGGNAMDAAIAAVAVQCVVEPHMTGIGGDCFAIIAEPDGALTGINGSGGAAAGVSADRLRDEGLTEIPPRSVHAVTVPGAIKTWAALSERFGTLGLDTCLRRAIELAEGGFAVSSRVGRDWSLAFDELAVREGFRQAYSSNGRAPGIGGVHHQPRLAKALQRIADNGPDGFYAGPVADDIASAIAGEGGSLNQDDLSAMSVEWVEPVQADYRGLTIAELPPNGQGLTAQILLRILEGFDVSGLDPLGAERIHLEMETARLAYACRDAFIADPQSMTVSPAQLLDEAAIAEMRAQIDPHRRMENVALPRLSPSDTVYLTVVDEDRMAVSFINSLYWGFGSGIVTPEFGITLQNRGACFSLQEGHPNELAPGRRPMHTIIPAMALRDGKPVMPFGVKGGDYQPVGHAHVISNLIDYAMDPQEAIDAPRVFWSAGGALDLEVAITDDTARQLASKGHSITRSGTAWGGGQLILMDFENDVLIGASDPRKDGCAIGY